MRAPGIVFSFTYPTPRLMSSPSRKSPAKDDIMRFTGEGVHDRQPYSERGIVSGFMVSGFYRTRRSLRKSIIQQLMAHWSETGFFVPGSVAM